MTKKTSAVPHFEVEIHVQWQIEEFSYGGGVGCEAPLKLTSALPWLGLRNKTFGNPNVIDKKKLNSNKFIITVLGLQCDSMEKRDTHSGLKRTPS